MVVDFFWLDSKVFGVSKQVRVCEVKVCDSTTLSLRLEDPDSATRKSVSMWLDSQQAAPRRHAAEQTPMVEIPTFRFREKTEAPTPLFGAHRW